MKETVGAQRLESQEQDQPPSTRSSSSNLVPLVDLGGSWTLNDEALADIYYRLMAEKLIDIVFWQGGVRTAEEFIEVMKRPSNFVVIPTLDWEPAGVAWLNGISGNYAFGHFVFFREHWGRQAVDLGKQVLDYWFEMGAPQPVFDVIIGTVPAFNARACRYVERLGFQRLGDIPRMMRADNGERYDAVVFYMTRS